MSRLKISQSKNKIGYYLETKECMSLDKRTKEQVFKNKFMSLCAYVKNLKA